MRDIELTPGYTTREKCLADHEYTDCLRALLGGGTENQEMRRTYEALVSFLQSPDLKRLRDQSERLLADGKKVTVRICLDGAEPTYEVKITD